MKRRKFIKKGFINLGAVLISPSLITSCKKDDPIVGKSVIVVGAGISGLAAARQLKDKGFDVTVLESQEKVGGRLRTNNSLGVAFDEGASWIHGIDGNPITGLAQKAGMNTFHTVDEDILSYDIGGVLRSEKKFDDSEAAYFAILETLMNNGSATKSFSTVFFEQYPQYANDRLWKFFLSTYMTFDRGDLDKTSSLLYNEGKEFEGIEVVSTNGFDMIPKYLATGLNVQLNQRVTMVDYSQEKVKVTHNGAISAADYAIITVPLGVLKQKSIQFTPDLPATKQTAIEKIGMNCVNKFLLTWDMAFWDDVQYITYTPEIRDKFNYFVNVKKFHPSVNALMTFAYADYGRQTEIMTDAEIIDEIMVHLRDIYGSNIPNPTNILRTKWDTNINSFGSYSFTAVGTEMRHFEELAAEVKDKLFFAGEHTEVDYFSTAHGAYLSGIREAEKIIDLQ
jgi:monoamine oxidase